MSVKLIMIFSCVAVLTLLAAGCTDDTVAPTGTGSAPGDVIDASIDPSTSEVSYAIDMAMGPMGPVRGPFVLRGRNIHYNDVVGALVVDFTVRNVGQSSWPEPVWVEFVKLLPDSVIIVNPDNDEHGPGAAVMFEFENDDAMWTPDEESFPRQVLFRTERGRAIGFVARIRVGMPPTDGGTIGGVVWHDLDQDGVRDPDEHGIAGAEVFLTMAPFEDSMAPEVLHRALTNRDGRYRFSGLRAGQYEVRKGLNPKLIATTPPAITVILVADGDGVSDFLYADFGCAAVRNPPDDDLQPGDFVRFSGAHNEDEHLFKARLAEVFECYDIRETSCAEIGYMVAGTIREIDRDRGFMRVMDVLMSVDSTAIDNGDSSSTTFGKLGLEVGDRVQVKLRAGPVMPVIPIAIAVRPWDSREDVLQGHVGMIDPDGDNRIVNIPALRSRVLVTPETIIGRVVF